MADGPRGAPAYAFLDSLAGAAAAEALRRCCGSKRWVDGMLDRRPFGSESALRAAARAVWAGLGREDYLEAFSHHPPIGGDMAALRAKFGGNLDWSRDEQSAVERAGDAILRELARANQAYLERFGYIFIICASGKSAREMLTALRSRITNSADAELALAAAEQSKITELRLEKLGR